MDLKTNASLRLACLWSTFPASPEGQEGRGPAPGVGQGLPAKAGSERFKFRAGAALPERWSPAGPSCCGFIQGKTEGSEALECRWSRESHSEKHHVSVSRFFPPLSLFSPQFRQRSEKRAEWKGIQLALISISFHSLACFRLGF